MIERNTDVRFTEWMQRKSPDIVGVVKSLKANESSAVEYLEALLENAFLHGWTSALESRRKNR